MKISEVSERYAISSDTLRYYERAGLIPPVSRNDSGIRDYSQTDVEWVDFIKCMRLAGLPIEVLAEYVRLVQQGDQTIQSRKAILIEQRDKVVAQMAEMQRSLDLINYKIEVYEDKLLKTERDFSRNLDKQGVTE